MGEFDGKVAIVTGASLGIGRACAERLTSGGAAVVVNARTPGPLHDTVDGLRAAGGEAVAAVGDLTDRQTPARVVATAIERFGRVDLLVNSLGLPGFHGRPHETDYSAFADTMIGNTWFAVALVGEAVKAGLADGGGAVVNISAIAAAKLIPGISQYCASQLALESLTRSMALDLGPDGIRVNAVQPGLVRSSATAPLLEGREDVLAKLVPLRRLGEPSDISNLVCFLLSEAASWITGQVIAVDGGYTQASTDFASVLDLG